MLKRIILFNLLFVFSLYSFSQKNTDTVAILDARVKIVVPKELTPMSDEMFAIKYGNKKKPILILSDKDAEVNLLADMTPQPATENDLAAYRDFRIEQLKKSRSDLEIKDKGLKTVNGKKVAYFKFLSQAIDQKVFNYFFFALIDGKVLLFTFNCIEKLQKEWEAKADTMLSTLKIR
jgi:hypothetical protein